MKPQDLTATSFVTSRLVTVAMVAVGVYFLAQSEALGWSALARLVGGESRLFGLGLFAAFVLLAALSAEKNALRVRTAELMDGMHQLLYGKNYERDRQAIDILLTALESEDGERRASAHRHLVRLTGQHFAPEAQVWRSWWTASRRHFAASQVPQDAAADGGGPAGGGESGGRAGE